MCGIAGALEFETGLKPSLEGLQRMTRVLAHRGPDGNGYYQSGPVGMGHQRLSIIDLASGHQPMESPDGQVCIVFNGEIYNYPEIKIGQRLSDVASDVCYLGLCCCVYTDLVAKNPKKRPVQFFNKGGLFIFALPTIGRSNHLNKVHTSHEYIPLLRLAYE